MRLRPLAMLPAFVLSACSQGGLPLSRSFGAPDGGKEADAGTPPPSSVIEIENRNSGDPRWNSFMVTNSHFIEAYADRVSATAGDHVQVMASSSRSADAHWRLYRIG